MNRLKGIWIDSHQISCFNFPEQELDVLLQNTELNSNKWGGRRYAPFAFTECGVAMLSTVLSSPKAISVNIAIMRTFVRLRSFLSMEISNTSRIGKLEIGTNKLFKVVFQKLDTIEKQITPKLSSKRKKIGLKND
jgi:hypothetical protein